MWWPYLDGQGVPFVPEYRKSAENYVRLARFAKPHYRTVLLDTAAKWLALFTNGPSPVIYGSSLDPIFMLIGRSQKTYIATLLGLGVANAKYAATYGDRLQSSSGDGNP